MEQVLFIVSAVAVINFLIAMGASINGNPVSSPIPILHKWDVCFKHCYVSTAALGYQVYFWSNYFGLFV